MNLNQLIKIKLIVARYTIIGTFYRLDLCPKYRMHQPSTLASPFQLKSANAGENHRHNKTSFSLFASLCLCVSLKLSGSLCCGFVWNYFQRWSKSNCQCLCLERKNSIPPSWLLGFKSNITLTIINTVNIIYVMQHSLWFAHMYCMGVNIFFFLSV